MSQFTGFNGQRNTEVAKAKSIPKPTEQERKRREARRKIERIMDERKVKGEFLW